MILKPNVNIEKTFKSPLSYELKNTDTIISKKSNNDSLYNINKYDIEINTCIITNNIFINCKMEKSYFIDVLFNNCDL